MTALVTADATVMTAQDNLASESQAAHLETRELLLEVASSGEASMDLLVQVQGYLSSNPADCSTLARYLASVSASGSVSGQDDGISFSSNASIVSEPSSAQGAAPENLTALAPFSGYVRGALDLTASLEVKEVGGGGSVSLQRDETEALNIPVSPAAASSLCDSSLGSLGAALSSSPCNVTLEQAAFERVLPGLISEARAEGFELTAGWGAGGASCSASYWVTLVEPGVAGPAGSFDWTVRGSGTTA